jgi:hypothetical protein
MAATVKQMEAIMSFVNKEANEDIIRFIQQATEEQKKELCMFAALCKDAFGLPVSLKEVFFALQNPAKLSELAMQKKHQPRRTAIPRRNNGYLTSFQIAEMSRLNQEAHLRHMEEHQRFVDRQNQQMFDQHIHQATMGF